MQMKTEGQIDRLAVNEGRHDVILLLVLSDAEIHLLPLVLSQLFWERRHPRPSNMENAPSRLLWEAKSCVARSVPAWGTSWESRVLWFSL